MKQFQSIDLVLENCEVIQIKSEHIHFFHVDEITRSISRFGTNTVHDMTSCKEFFLQISPLSKDMSSYDFTYNSNTTLPFDRLLKHQDLVAVNIKFDDNSEKYIYVSWGGESDWINVHQTCRVSEQTGDLFIVVSESKTADTYFKRYL